jgi:hypothetical protein
MPIDLLTCIATVQLATTGPFREFINQQLASAFAQHQLSSKVEQLLQLAAFLRAGGHITEDLNNE